MANTEVGAAYVSVYPNTAGFSQTLESQIKSQLDGGALNSISNRVAESLDTHKWTSRFGAGLANFARTTNSVAAGVGDVITSTIGNITAGITTLALTGGFRRALNLEQAEHLFDGIGLGWNKTTDVLDEATGAYKTYADIVNEAVLDTQFSLDEAAVVAASLGAAGITSGADMSKALRGVTGVASTFGASLSDVGNIFQKVAAQGRVTGDHIFQMSQRGINALSVLSDYYGKSQEDVQKMVSAGKVSFEDFSEAMSEAFGDSAKSANDTFNGALSNMQAALSRIGAKFAGPTLDALKHIFNALRPLINAVSKALDPFVSKFTEFIGIAEDGSVVVGGLVDKVITKIGELKGWVESLGKDGFASLTGSAKALGIALGVVTLGSIGGLLSKIPILGEAFGGLFGVLGLLARPLGTINGFFGASHPIMMLVAAGLALLYVKSEDFRKAADQLIGMVGRLIGVLQPLAEQIMSSIGPVVERIIQLLGTLLSDILPLITVFIEAIVTILEYAMPTIQAIVETGLNVLKGIIDVIMAVLRGDWEAAWDGLKNVVDTILGGLETLVETAFTGIATFITDTLNGIFGGLGDWLARIVNGTDESMGEMDRSYHTGFSSAEDTVSSSMHHISDSVGDGVDESIEEFRRIPNETSGILDGIDYSDSGYAAGNSFASGIRGAIGAVSSAALSLVEAAAQFLPHSPAKKGPFSGKGWTLYSGMSIVDALAEGARRESGGALATFRAITEQIRSSLAFGSETASYGLGIESLGVSGSSPFDNQAARGGDTYITMNVTADSETTLDNLIAQARRAKALNGGF